MNNLPLRTALISCAAALAAVWIGAGIAQEEYTLAFMVTAVAALMLVTAITPQPIEAWVLGSLAFAYVVGNRGFAQLMPIPGLPAFFGELGLALCGVILTLRGALQRRLPVQRDAVNLLLLAWIGLATARVGFDLQSFGLVALRDYAMVYYAFFFFIAQEVAGQERNRALLRTWLTVAFVVLPVTASLFEAFPAFFLTKFTVRNTPIMFYKDDLVGTFLFAGFIYLLPHEGEFLPRQWWRWAFALGSLGVGLAQLSRAGMVGLAVATAWLALSGRWRAFKVLTTAAVLGTLILSFIGVFFAQDVTRSRAYAIYEQVVSIADLEGHRTYRNAETADSPDNNRFRLVWWRTIGEETLHRSPLFGQGFGYDLARGFLQVYNPLADDFTARSPHSVIFTNLGRLGLVGLGTFVAWMFYLAGVARRTAQRARSDGTALSHLTLQATLWVVLVSACFGVVLEGPMGAIPFWIMAGLALGEFRGAESESAVDSANRPGATTTDEGVPSPLNHSA